jgi:hypothetical protein
LADSADCADCADCADGADGPDIAVAVRTQSADEIRRPSRSHQRKKIADEGFVDNLASRRVVTFADV